MLSTHELAEILGTSLPTVRRDLAVLEQAGLVSRTHGGVVAQRADRVIGEPMFLEKLRLRQNLKRRIGEAAAALVGNNQVVLIDSGTTCLAVARALAGRPVTVVATDLKVAEAAASGVTEVLMVGGRVRNGYYSLVGSWPRDTLQGIRADIMFMGADALDETGVTNSTLDEAEVKRMAISRSDRIVLLADHSKIGMRSFVPVCPLEDIHVLVTDRKAEPLLGPYAGRLRAIQCV